MAITRLSAALSVLTLSFAVNGLPQNNKKTLVWESCPELNKQIAELSSPLEITPFDCAHLEVPLDYRNPDAQSITLDLFKINATKEPVLGSILYNPGGPGGTGAENLPISAPDLHYNIGGQYNLVSWDPRGTGNTIPFNCGLADAMSSSTNTPTRRDVATLVSTNNTEAFLNGGGWDQAVQIAETCATVMNETGQFIGTGSVARDMIEIVDALDEDGLLRYYGWSYGSALGDYVAAMFPDRVERMVLDGNVNPHTWQLGYRPELLEATDKAFAAFVDECVANAENCALVTALNATTSAEIFDAFNAVLSPLAKNATSSIEAFAALVAADGAIYGQLYYPANWPALAKTLADMLLGVAPEEEESTAPAPAAYNKGPDSIHGIRCSDATFQVSSPEEYLPILQAQEASTEGFQAVYAAVWPCAAWKMPSAEQYRGDFKAKTRHPILFVNGEFDVATPISGAYNASAGFEGSVVLAHNGYGHGIFPSPSKCVAEKIQRYFVDGTLPEEGTTCEPDFGPWERAAYYAENNITRPY